MDASFYRLKRFWYQHQSEIIVVLLALLVFFCRLQEGDLRNDSVFYAAITKEMVESGDWLQLTYNQQPYYGKPPLMFWLTGIFFKYFGDNTFTAKFWSCFFGVGCVWLTFRLGRRMFGERIGFVSAIILTLTYTFFRNTIAFRLDSITTFCYLTGIYAIYVVLQTSNSKQFLWWGAALGLGLMAKGPGILMLVLIAVVALLWEKQWRLLGTRWFWGSILLAVIIAGPWHLYTLQDPDFVHQYVQVQNLERFSSEGPYKSSPWYFYIFELVKFYWPWLPFAVLGAMYSWQVHRIANRTAWKVCFIWFVVVSIGIMLIEKKYDRYLMPLFPLFAILAATDIEQRFAPRFWHWARPAVLTTTLIAGWVIACLPIPVHSIQDEDLHEIIPIVREFEKNGNHTWVYGIDRKREGGRILFYLSLHCKWHDPVPRPDSSTTNVLLVTSKQVAEEVTSAGWQLYFKRGKYCLWRNS